MERYSQLIIGLLLLTSLFSCNLSDVEEFEVGEGFVDTSAGVVLIDTMNVVASTIRFDSIITSAAGSILLGGYKNSSTGIVTSNPHFDITSGSFTIDDDDLVYDSLVVKMNYDGYYVGDTTKLISFTVKRISEELELNDDGYLYNSSSFDLANENLGQVQFYPYPASTKKMNIRLSDKFGIELFAKIIGENDTVSNSIYFKEYFKGMAFVSSENQNQVAVGFAHDSIDMRVYYHELVKDTESKDKTYFSFPVDVSGVWFNQIKHNVIGSLLETISQSKNELPSSSTSDFTMVQAGSGIYTKIKIPGISYLKGYGKNVAFIGSEIRITPLKGSYSEANLLPDSLSVYIANRKNKITSQLSNSDGYIYASKVIPAELSKLPYYVVDISAYFTSELAASGISETSLFIGPVASKSATTMSPVVFSPVNSGQNIVKMSVYCYIDKSK